MANDMAMLSIALWAAYSLRLSQPMCPDSTTMWVLMAAAPLIGVITFHMRGLYKLVTRFIGPSGTTRIYIAVDHRRVDLGARRLDERGEGASALGHRDLWTDRGGSDPGEPAMGGGAAAHAAPQHKPVSFDERKNVIIYGTGAHGHSAASRAERDRAVRTVAFIDNDPSLAGQVVHGVKVVRPNKIAKVISHENVKEVMLALPSTLRSERRAAIKALEPYPVQVKTLPALEEIASGRVEVSDLRPIDVEDLLGRDPVAPDNELLLAHVRDKVVMITGAGGSIGSELTRQLLMLGPKALVLFELSEVALYEIEMEIEEFRAATSK